jgi:hypothetical protein
MSPGFHGRSLLTRELGKLTHQILRVARAAPVVSMAPNLPRGDIFMTVFTPTVTFAVGALRKPARDRHHDPCYKLMATFHKMKDESGNRDSPLLRSRARRARVHAGQPDQRPAGGVGATRRRIAAAGLHSGNSQHVDVSHFGAHRHVPLGSRPCWRRTWGCCSRGRRVSGAWRSGRPQSVEMARSDPKRDAAQS